jgi:hypothetical protein
MDKWERGSDSPIDRQMEKLPTDTQVIQGKGEVPPTLPDTGVHHTSSADPGTLLEGV